MSKNTATFHRLPNGKFGLVKWFPELKDKKQTPTKAPLDDNQSQQGTEIPLTIKKVGRPKKIVQQEPKEEEPKEEAASL